MSTRMHERLREAIRLGVKARSDFYQSIELPDEQVLGEPADPAKISALESRLGKLLPPSYRAFLEIHDGWKMVDAETDLLSIDEMLEGPRAKKIKRWQEQAISCGDEVIGRSLIIGHSNISQSRIALDSESTADEGEWRVIEKYKDEEVGYPSFVAWLEQSVKDYQAIVSLPGDESDIE